MQAGEQKVFRIKVPMIGTAVEQELCCTTSEVYAARLLEALLVCQDNRLAYVKVEVGFEIKPLPI